MLPNLSHGICNFYIYSFCLCLGLFVAEFYSRLISLSNMTMRPVAVFLAGFLGGVFSVRTVYCLEILDSS